MSFYRDIHEAYEDIFPAGPHQVAFLTKLLTENRSCRILDAACGTGAYARALAAAGFWVTGLDLEEGMIREARKRAASLAYAGRLDFRKGDMRDLEAFRASCDALLCLGNSLPHLLAEEDLLAFFRGGREALRGPGGLIILQTVNFDRVLGKEDYRFPLIRREENSLTFFREYRPRRDGLLDFVTELTLTRSGKTLRRKNSVPLKPLLKKDLDRYLEESGFAAPVYYGSFNFEPWNEHSPATILLANPGTVLKHASKNGSGSQTCYP